MGAEGGAGPPFPRGVSYGLPDFVLEITSRNTGQRDTVGKRTAYTELSIPEYWRFYETGKSHGTSRAFQVGVFPDQTPLGHLVYREATETRFSGNLRPPTGNPARGARPRARKTRGRASNLAITAGFVRRGCR